MILDIAKGVKLTHVFHDEFIGRRFDLLKKRVDEIDRLVDEIMSKHPLPPSLHPCDNLYIIKRNVDRMDLFIREVRGDCQHAKYVFSKDSEYNNGEGHSEAKNYLDMLAKVEKNALKCFPDLKKQMGVEEQKESVAVLAKVSKDRSIEEIQKEIANEQMKMAEAIQFAAEARGILEQDFIKVHRLPKMREQQEIMQKEYDYLLYEIDQMMKTIDENQRLIDIKMQTIQTADPVHNHESLAKENNAMVGDNQTMLDRIKNYGRALEQKDHEMEALTNILDQFEKTPPPLTEELKSRCKDRQNLFEAVAILHKKNIEYLKLIADSY